MPTALPDYEKLGVFYLGREYDLDARKAGPRLVLLESRDLVTHAVIVGMTGSGKTGLGIALLEEAAIDGIPALIIDPKGDLANLLLTFPGLRPADFGPWINAEEARRHGKTAEEYAAEQANLWKKGLADWGQDGERIARLRAAVDIGLYTPGSSAATPLSIVQSFAAPPEAVLEDSEALSERVSNAAASLLSLLGVGEDSLQSREHILVSSILAHAWKAGNDLDLPRLIHLLQTPPFERVGVMDLESFFPAKERFAFALRLNNLLASPGFETWLQGPPLDIERLLFTPEGKPRLSILSIAHLGDKERMFFVTLLLNQALGWMRSQPGTTSLRALLYMDEIFGYFPPVANPPSKTPLLTLLKQARAFGLGIVLATQNPVDLDYKGLANTGAWFIGRLQTERDKARLLDGLEGAASAAGSAFDRTNMDRLLSGLGNRVFLLNNVHDDGPCVFQVRWVLSYLRGPMTRAQLKQLAAAQPADNPVGKPAAPPEARPEAPAFKPVFEADSRPVLPPAVPQFFLPATTPAPPGARLVYTPRILGRAAILFRDTARQIDHEESVTYLADPSEAQATLSWADATPCQLGENDLGREPMPEAGFAPLPGPAALPKNYDLWKKALTDHLFRAHTLELLECPALDETSMPGETEAAFRIRLVQRAREERDLQAEKLRQKFAPKLATLQERVRKAQITVEKEKSQASQSKLQTVLSFGSTLLGAIFGRKKVSVTTIGKATTTARGMGRSTKEAKDVEYASQNVDALQTRLNELEEEFQTEVDRLNERLDIAALEMTRNSLKPKKTNIQVQTVALAWLPCWKKTDEQTQPAWVP